MSNKYPKALIFIHWITLILFVIVFIIGTNMEEYDFTEENFPIYRTHALLGLLISFLTIIRLVIRSKGNLPEPITYYNRGHQALVTGIRHLMYTLLIAAPVIGFIMVYQTGAFGTLSGQAFPQNPEFNETLEEAHKYMVFILLAAVILHIGGVILYKIKTGENLLRRMCMLMK